MHLPPGSSRLHLASQIWQSAPRGGGLREVSYEKTKAEITRAACSHPRKVCKRLPQKTLAATREKHSADFATHHSSPFSTISTNLLQSKHWRTSSTSRHVYFSIAICVPRSLSKKKIDQVKHSQGLSAVTLLGRYENLLQEKDKTCHRGCLSYNRLWKSLSQHHLELKNHPR